MAAHRRWPVIDVVLIAATLVFFALAGAYAAACDKL
jgi:hypothetical protein